MKRYCVIITLCLCLLAVTGCQESAKSAGSCYCNPCDFDPQTMSVVMIDEAVYLKTVDGKSYDENISVWEAKPGLQRNLIIPAGWHTLGVVLEKSYHHLYGKDIVEIEFTAEPDKVYRILKGQRDGRDVIGIFDKTTLVAEAKR